MARLITRLLKGHDILGFPQLRLLCTSSKSLLKKAHLSDRGGYV